MSTWRTDSTSSRIRKSWWLRFEAFVTCQAENSERDFRASIRYWSIYIIPLSKNNVAVPVARKAFINSIADSYAACSVFFLYSSGILSISE